MKKVVCQFERVDQRGLFREYINSDDAWKAVNQGVMKKGAVMGNHYHEKCKAAFFLLSGSAQFIYKNVLKKQKPVTFLIREGEGVLIDPYETHAITFLEKSSFLVLKSKKFDPKHKDLHEAKLV
jgi:mannose-6-phosphate isomerase-like protein (cupin superfamily)